MGGVRTVRSPTVRLVYRAGVAEHRILVWSDYI